MRLSATNLTVLGGLVAGGLVLGLAQAPGHAREGADTPTEATGAQGAQPGTTLDDQVDLALTVYNSNIALVRDVRELALPEGVFDLSYIDIAATINPATVHFRSLTQPDSLRVLEQNYEYDLLDPQKLLQKFVGRDVTLVRTRQDAGTTIAEEVRATLLAYNNGPIWRIGDEIVTGMHADHIRFPELPENLYSRPTMVWALDNAGPAVHRVEAAYRNNETKQISLLTGAGVPVQKRFVVDGQQFYYRNQQHPGSPLRDPVKVFFRFKNDQESGLGMPLPEGNVRVYQADASGGIQFVGEDRVEHTPQNETLNLQIGSAFDVVAERTQTDFTRVSSLIHEIAFEVTLRNHKDEPIEVEINEPIGGDWRMLQSTHDWTQSAAWAARFTVPVEANGTAVLRYRVRVRS